MTQTMTDILKHADAEKGALLTEIAATIQQKGFAHAWFTYLDKIVKLYHKGHRKRDKTITGRDLFALMQTLPELKNHFDSLPAGTVDNIEASFLPENKIPKWQTVAHEDFNEAIQELYVKNVSYWHEVTEADGQPVAVLENEVFQNWGRTVENIPKYTCFPRSKVAVQNIVRYAKTHNKKVRVSGYRHTWSDLYAADDQILISSLSLSVATHLPAQHPPIDPKNDLQGIKMVGTIEENGVTKGLCKIGAATTNEQFRLWATGENGDAPSGWTVPLNVIMVEITWGGSISAICHGAGLRHKTLSDLVYEIEYVDANGEIRTISDPYLLTAAAGCFGLLGVVTAVTLKLDKMTYTNMRPYKERLALSIPPPEGFKVPKGVDMSGITSEQTNRAWQKFVNDAENKFYSEWFWFAFQKDCWVNCWDNDGKAADSVPYPSKFNAKVQEMQEYIAELMSQSKLYQWLSPEIQTLIVASSAMYVMPHIPQNKPAIITPITNGLHFRRGIQNWRMYDMEWEIPIPARADDPTKPDWTICQKAWWAVIQVFYDRYNRDNKDIPMRLTMEMRIMGDSDILLAPQYGNSFGTCSIEVLTILTTPKDEWRDFLQEITSAWESFTDASGNPLNIRPHWAKEWEGLKIRNMDIVDYLKNVAYKDQLSKFKKIIQMIAQEQDFTLSDLQNRFSNPLIDNLLEDVFDNNSVMT
ncbi:MAG: FAD-binding oxidoreductase [Saprospiraceae bacterium]|nr:FAD-binding oxidoreductase [Saprospiraceae bacterium]